MAKYTVCLCLLLSSFSLCIKAEYLFRQSPGGDGYKSSGLWGGMSPVERLGDANNLYSYGYESLNISHTTQYGIDIEYLAFDPVSKRVLMVTEDPDGLATSEKHSISFGGLCRDSMAELYATFHTFKLTDHDNPYLSDTDCGWKCGWGPFGYYDSKIYFVLSAVFGKSYSNLNRVIQIRQIDGCEDIVTSMMISEHKQTLFEFPVLQCSKLIATLYEEKYTKPVPQIDTWPAKELKVLEYDGTVHIMLQLFHKNEENFEATLNLVHVNTQTINSGAVISSSAIGSVYSGNAKITGLGAIDYDNGFLCWTVTDKLFCGLYSFDGILVEKTLIIDGNTAMEEDVCQTDNLPIAALQETLTGVAISDTGDTLSVYFGCYADIPATGGVGLVQISHHGLNKQIYPVKSGSHRVYGGYLFVSDTVDNWCDYVTSSLHTKDKSSTSEAMYTTRSGNDPQYSDSLPSISLGSRLYFAWTLILITLVITVQ